MATASTVENYLRRQHVPYEVLAHSHTHTSLQSARAAHVAPDAMAKAVLLRDSGQYLMAIIPGTHHLQLGRLRRQLGRDLGLATENEMAALFQDCEPGALPALGPAYGIETVWDDSLRAQSELCFEAGDHEHLVRMKRRDYLELLAGCPHGAFSEPIPGEWNVIH